MRPAFVPLGDIAEIIAGQSPPSSTYNNEGVGLPFFQGKADFGEVYPTVRMWCSDPQKIAEANDILISVRAPVGPTNIAPTQCCIGRGLSAIRPLSRLNHRFLLHYLRSVEAKLADAGRGSTFGSITQTDLKELSIPLPPLDDQRRIAAILDKADTIRRKRRETIRLTDEFLRSVFLAMFGDPVTNPKGWDSGYIDDVVRDPRRDVRCGPFGTQLKVAELVDEGIPLWGIENVRDNKFVSACRKYLTPSKADELDAFRAGPGDVLVTRMGTVGKACVVPEDAGEGRISYHLFRVRVAENKCLPDFLAATISRSGVFQHQLELRAHGAIMAGLSTTDLRGVAFLLPPLPEQRRYVSLVKTADRLLMRMNYSERGNETLLLTLSQRAFKGEL
jgi:type I restriction enzyme, S subunit